MHQCLIFVDKRTDHFFEMLDNARFLCILFRCLGILDPKVFATREVVD